MNKERPGKIVISLLLMGAMIVGGFSPGALGGLVQAAEVQEPFTESAKTNELTEPTQENEESGTEAENIKPEEGAQTKETDTTGSVSETEPGSAIPEEQSESNSGSGSISGMIWLDANENGTYDIGEKPVAGYEVSLYTAGDKEHAVDTVDTDGDGKYQFAGLQPDDYVAGIPLNQSVDGTKYLASLVGISGDNQFGLDAEAEAAYTSNITITSGSAETDYHAGVHLLPAMQTMSTGIQPKADTVYTVNSTVIGFAGHEWWVIGNSTSGVESPSNTMLTLWSKKHDQHDLGDSTFRTNTAWNAYADASALLTTMENLAATFPTDTREHDMIANRAILDDVGESTFGYGQPINQMFWPLSKTEWGTVVVNAVRAYGTSSQDHYWLRTPYKRISPDPNDKTNAYFGAYGGSYADGHLVNNTHAVRPAFYLDQSSVLYTSDASGAGMKSAASGVPVLTDVTKPTGAIKLTVADNSLTLGTNTTSISSPPGGTKTFDYSGVSTGAGRSVSVMICDKTTNNILYYGRPVDLSGSAGTSGTATFTVPSDLEIGKDYTLRIFNEEVNGENYTDYAGTPVEIPLKIRVVNVNLTPSTTDKVNHDGGNGTVDIKAAITNPNRISGSTIEDAKWFRVPISDTTQYDTEAAFEAKYSSISETTHKGVIHTKSSTQETLSDLPVDTTDINATYWVMGTVKDATISPAEIYYGFDSLTVDNIYDETPVNVRGEISASEELYDYEVVSGTYGIPYDFGTSTVLSNPRLNYDTVTLNAKSPYNNATYWTYKMKNSNNPVPYTLDLDEDFVDTSLNTECDGSDVTKYTIRYTRTGSWRPITAKFVDESGATLTSMGNITSETFNAPIDVGGGVTAFLSNGGSYLPPNVTDYTVIGYRVGSMTGTFVSCTDFTGFNPTIPSGISDVYIVYRSNTTDLSISNTVTGDYADLTKTFTYTIFFYDSNGTPLADGTQFDYTGGTVGSPGATAPPDGTFTLGNGDGSAVITLSNGQSIAIEKVSVLGKVKIVQTSANGYTTSYEDSINPGADISSNDTTVLDMTSAVRAFAFTNTRNAITPAGVSTGSAGSILLIIPVLLLVCTVSLAVWRTRRRTEAK